MRPLTRRQALSWGLLAPMSLGASPAQPAAAGIKADLLVVNATILTMDESSPTASALAVSGGRILAVGSRDELMGLKGPHTEVLDLKGLTVLPGFIDAHCHPGETEELFDVNADVRTVAEIQQRLRAKAQTTPPGQWVRAFKFDDTKLADGRVLSRADLDAAVPDHPVRVDHRGGHTSWFNSRAFALAGITASTADPSNGRFYKDDHGQLQGEVAERARDVFDTVGVFASFSEDEVRTRYQQATAFFSKKLVAAGLTSVHDAWTVPEKLRAYQDSDANGELYHRATVMPVGMGERSLYALLSEAGVMSGLGNERVRIGAVKFWADGSASERTMRMSTPFVGKPNDYGILVMDQQEIHAAVERAHRHGWQVAIHANGDVAIDMVLNAYERVQSLWPLPDRRHRIEHCTYVTPALVKRIKDTGSIPTPFWTYVYYHGEKWAAYGDDKLRSFFAHRWFLDAGIKVPGASDYSPGPFEPMMALQSLVTRTDSRGHVWGANQRVSIAEALRIATINGAFASKEEHLKGSLTPGKVADFVVLGQNPLTVDPFALKDIPIVRTVVNGKTVFAA